MSGAVIAVYALVAAAVAATASTVIKSQTTGFGEEGAEGNWMKTFFTAFATSVAAGGAGAASDGASAGADTGMYAGVSNADMAAMTAPELAEAGVGTTGDIAATDAAAMGAEGGSVGTDAGVAAADANAAMNVGDVTADVLEAAQDSGSQLFADQQMYDLSNEAQQVLAEPEPSLWDQLGDFSFSDYSPTKNIMTKLFDVPEYQVNQLSEYGDLADEAGGMLANDQPEQRNPELDAFTRSLQLGGMQSIGKEEGMKQAFYQSPELYPEMNTGFLFGDYDFNYDYLKNQQESSSLGSY